ncbi:hypothetical protein WMY93_004019 [Mugilogobius chulae]|uniref:Sugar phosphate transporter domain-containing protein n=1 Tax=Mugilogobius chulae TaxID=88201 RepID=A0AAW0PR58_9GOBI
MVGPRVLAKGQCTVRSRRPPILQRGQEIQTFRSERGTVPRLSRCPVWRENNRTCFSTESCTMTSKCLQSSAQPSALAKFLSALFYATSSFLITVVNKTVLTGYRFPSYAFLGIGQMTTTIAVLYVAKKSKAVQFQDFDRSILLKIFPLPLLYTCNHITGLGSTKNSDQDLLYVPPRFLYSLPMFTVLRKFTILMTMVLEMHLLSSDLAFEVEGYVFILLNDVFTAAYGVYTKKKLGVEGLGKYGVLFYNALIIVIPATIVCAYTGDLDSALTFQDWTQVTFLLCFIVSCVMGFVLMYSIVLCSHYNSALTTTVVGAIKNVAVAYIGIFVGGDYLFSWPNFLGLTICMSGGLVYSYISFNTTTETTIKEVKIDATENPLSTHSAKD